MFPSSPPRPPVLALGGLSVAPSRPAGGGSDGAPLHLGQRWGLRALRCLECGASDAFATRSIDDARRSIFGSDAEEGDGGRVDDVALEAQVQADWPVVLVEPEEVD